MSVVLTQAHLIKLSLEITLGVLCLMLQAVPVDGMRAQVLWLRRGHRLLLFEDRLEEIPTVDVGGGPVLQPVLREGAFAGSGFASHWSG